MTDAQRRAVTDPLARLQSALDYEQHTAAIGAAKDLVEAACKVAIERGGEVASRNIDLPRLFRLTLPDDAARGSELGRSLVTVVQRLATLRNIAGAGHGQASLEDASAANARLAASAACGLAEFILGGISDA
jgi:hypothetical protein